MAQEKASITDQYPEVIPHTYVVDNVNGGSTEQDRPKSPSAPEHVPPRYLAYPGHQLLASRPTDIASNAPQPSGQVSSYSLSDTGLAHRRKVVGSGPTNTLQHHPSDANKEYRGKEGALTSFEEPSTPEPEHIKEQSAFGSGIPPKQKEPIYKRRRWIILGAVALVLVIVAIVCGAVFGTRKPKSASAPTPSSSNSTSPQNTTITGDPQIGVGGYLNPSYYSTSGAWNGSGVTVAAANPGSDNTLYVFYQDYAGQLSWKLMKIDGSFSQPLGTINDQSSQPLNGTPISIVLHVLGDSYFVYHFFYIDSDYHIVERVLETGNGVVTSGSVVPVWTDGLVNQKKLKTMEAETIGMQACYWLNFYGDWSPNDTVPSAGLQLWYATSETQFAQYSWTNGTDTWNFDQNWNSMDGHGGVGCNTYDGWNTEYIFFVDTNQDIAVFWRDNNQSVQSTATHPTQQWTLANVSISNLQKDTSFGYTNYIAYQLSDTSINGVNVSWNAEYTAISDEITGSDDFFVITDLDTNKPVQAVRGTHLAITAVGTASGGEELLVFFQQEGDDISLYTRDLNKLGGLWQRAGRVV